MSDTPLPSSPSSDNSGLPLPSMRDNCYVTAMSHLYRGELGRIMVWRQRLDVTTTWAITSTTSIITVAFSFQNIPHIVFVFNLAFVWVLLWIEARRYRFYDAFRGRVRMLESHFFVPMISQSQNLLDGEWRRLVCEDLILPSFKISKIEAVSRRLKRNYVFIFAIIMVAWAMKVIIHAPGPVISLDTFYQAWSVHALPAWFSLIVYLGTIIAVFILVFHVSRKTSEEISEFSGSNRSLWRL